MARELSTADPATVLRRIFTAAVPGATYYAADLPMSFTTALGTAMDDAEEPPEVRVLSTREPLRALRQDFLAASKAANHVETGRLAIRERTDPAGESVGRTGSPLVVGEGAVHALLALDDGRASRLSGRGGSFPTAARDRLDRQWETADRYPLRTPARARVSESLEAEWGAVFREDFEESLAQASAMRNPAEFEV